MIDVSPMGIAVNSASFPDKKPPMPKETKKIPIMVLTFFGLASMVIADNPMGDKNNSANEIMRYAGMIASGDNKAAGALE